MKNGLDVKSTKPVWEKYWF